VLAPVRPSAATPRRSRFHRPHHTRRPARSGARVRRDGSRKRQGRGGRPWARCPGAEEGTASPSDSAHAAEGLQHDGAHVASRSAPRGTGDQVISVSKLSRRTQGHPGGSRGPPWPGRAATAVDPGVRRDDRLSNPDTR
jgi:hypothetical protein